MADGIQLRVRKIWRGSAARSGEIHGHKVWVDGCTDQLVAGIISNFMQTVLHRTPQRLHRPEEEPWLNYRT